MTLYYTLSPLPIQQSTISASSAIFQTVRQMGSSVGTGSLCLVCPHCLPAKAAKGCTHVAEAGPALMVADLGPLHLDHAHVCQGLQQNSAMGGWMLVGTCVQSKTVVSTTLNVTPKVRHLQLEACVPVCVLQRSNIPCTTTQVRCPTAVIRQTGCMLQASMPPDPRGATASREVCGWHMESPG